MTVPSASLTPLRSTSATRADASEELGRRQRQPLRQRRQDAVGRLEQDELYVLRRVDAVEAVGDQLARRVVQLGRQLHPGRAGADDGDLKLLRPQRPGLSVGADAGVDQAAAEPLGVGRRVEGDGVLADPRRPEVVGEAADGDDQGVVGDDALRRNLAAFVVDERRDADLAPLAVEADHLADAIAEMVPVRLRVVVDLVDAEVEAAGRDLVQQRLPEMRPRLVDEGDFGAPPPAQGVAEPRRELQPAGAAAHDDDPMRGRTLGHAVGGNRARDSEQGAAGLRGRP
jgi:hypothetical protein